MIVEVSPVTADEPMELRAGDIAVAVDRFNDCKRGRSYLPTAIFGRLLGEHKRIGLVVVAARLLYAGPARCRSEAPTNLEAGRPCSVFRLQGER